jgi:hypothetical protein
LGGEEKGEGGDLSADQRSIIYAKLNNEALSALYIAIGKTVKSFQSIAEWEAQILEKDPTFDPPSVIGKKSALTRSWECVK